jgi:glycosyltransferase involved in cell wall biosynthesis
VAIESILQQTFGDFELIIIDDGSTDNSIKIIETFKDNRIKLIKNNENLKLIKTLNIGLKLAKGKYIARMDSDDIAHKERFKKQIDFLENNPNISVLGTGFEVIDNPEKKVMYDKNHNDIKWKQLYECHILHPSVMIRRSVIIENNYYFDEKFPHCEDYELWTRISRKNQLANLKENLMFYREWEDNISHRHKETQERNSIIVRKNIFKWIGVELNEMEINLFRELSYHNYLAEINIVKTLLEKIYISNKSSNYFPQSFLKKKIKYIWLHFNINKQKNSLKNFLIYFKAELPITLNLFKIIRLFIKASIK